jgi:uncharacterized coiled-coil protein SlyX
VSAEDTTYRVWEAGRKPSRAAIAALEQLFGEAAPGDVASAPDMAALIGALTDQAKAMTSLVQTVVQDAGRAERMDQQLAALTDAVTRLADRMAAWEQGGGAPPGSPLPEREGEQRRGGGRKSHADAL